MSEAGLVTAEKEGEALVTVMTTNNLTATCTVTVTAPSVPQEPTGVTLNNTTINLGVGIPQTLIATVTPDDAVDKTVTWTSEDPTSVTVDSNGLLTALVSGVTVDVTATTVNGLTATCAVRTVDPMLDE